MKWRCANDYKGKNINPALYQMNISSKHPLCPPPGLGDRSSQTEVRTVVGNLLGSHHKPVQFSREIPYKKTNMVVVVTHFVVSSCF